MPHHAIFKYIKYQHNNNMRSHMVFLYIYTDNDYFKITHSTNMHIYVTPVRI